jgi:phosphoribosylanthranilate isomerase
VGYLLLWQGASETEAMSPKIKICGLNSEEGVAAALAGGADFVGFVFYGPSPRNVTPERAADLARALRGKAQIVALTVDADDDLLAGIDTHLAPDWYQLHGREGIDRVREIKDRFARPVIKAVHVAGPGDVAAGAAYIDVADMLLYDAKAPDTVSGALPGGNGISFDWDLLRAKRSDVPVMLSGGLDAGNVAAAIRLVSPDAVDVSSGVERAPGEKDPEKIAAFIATVRKGDEGRAGGSV